jgi:hypothetical protein
MCTRNIEGLFYKWQEHFNLCNTKVKIKIKIGWYYEQDHDTASIRYPF